MPLVSERTSDSDSTNKECDYSFEFKSFRVPTGSRVPFSLRPVPQHYYQLRQSIIGFGSDLYAPVREHRLFRSLPGHNSRVSPSFYGHEIHFRLRDLPPGGFPIGYLVNKKVVYNNSLVILTWYVLCLIDESASNRRSPLWSVCTGWYGLPVVFLVRPTPTVPVSTPERPLHWKLVC